MLSKIKAFISDIRIKRKFDAYIKQNPEKMVCYFCLSNCGQCGGDGHHIPLKDLKSSEDYKQGWTRLISKHFIK